MEKIAMILRRPPYGDINAAEAVRHALGAVSNELSVILILMHGGVLLAKKGQDETGTGFTNLGGALKDCVDMGVEVYADTHSVREHRLEQGEIIDGVKMAGNAEIAQMMKDAKTTMIF